MRAKNPVAPHHHSPPNFLLRWCGMTGSTFFYDDGYLKALAVVQNMRHERRLAGAEEARQNGGQRALARRVHRLGRGLNYPSLPIHEAARYWDVDQIQELISKGVNPDALCRRE